MLRNGTPAELHDAVITVYRGADNWRERLAYSAEHRDDAYLIVLDRNGIVRWIHHGGFDRSTAAELNSLLTALADAKTGP